MTGADVRAAIMRLHRAAVDATAVASLPSEIGATVRWANGLLWERTGEDAWRPVFEPDGDGWQPTEEDIEAMTAPSLHIASGTFDPREA